MGNTKSGRNHAADQRRDTACETRGTMDNVLDGMGEILGLERTTVNKVRESLFEQRVLEAENAINVISDSNRMA